MEKLNYRIQRQNNLNDVYVSSAQEAFNNVHHRYVVTPAGIAPVDSANRYNGLPVGALVEINFQKGARKDPDSTQGVLEGDLLEIVRDRLQGHQASEYKTREGALALTAVEEALLWLAKRADDRAERGVLGTTEK